MVKYGYEKSNLTGLEYCLKEHVRVVDPKQQKLYVKKEVYPVVMYTTLDENTGEVKLVMIFSKRETKDLYILWKNRELK